MDFWRRSGRGRVRRALHDVRVVDRRGLGCQACDICSALRPGAQVRLTPPDSRDGFRSEISLCADVQADRVLILERVSRRRLGCGRREERGAGKHLIEMRVEDLRGEGQVLDRDPAGDDADLADVEIRIADIVGARNACSRGFTPP